MKVLRELFSYKGKIGIICDCLTPIDIGEPLPEDYLLELSDTSTEFTCKFCGKTQSIPDGEVK